MFVEMGADRLGVNGFSCVAMGEGAAFPGSYWIFRSREGNGQIIKTLVPLPGSD
ncbi:hypothetical protein SCARR_02067 [Pontiella sulfatireligans]|uniref:Uncharacterized protein n=1 Tax=Pontiella sulfatireligans TaxID=2750658 RepID=A0A6C2UKR7_9BACT|nr:hypothetical protein SCARR_02067 [Pontiella sulfatireligans]